MAFIDDHKEFGFGQPNPKGLRKQEIPDIFNPNWISEESAKASSALALTREYLGACQTMFNEANVRRSLPDMYSTQAANERDVETLVGKIDKKAFEGLAPVRRALAADKASVQRNIDSIGALEPDEYAPEIRAAFKAMKPEDAQAALSVAVDNNERQTLAAVLDAPTVTTGLSPELRAALKARYLERLAPQQTKLLAQLDKAEQYAAKAELSILPTVTALYEGTGKHKQAQELLAQIKANYAE